MTVDPTVLATELGALFSALLAAVTAVVALINSFRTHELLIQMKTVSKLQGPLEASALEP